MRSPRRSWRRRLLVSAAALCGGLGFGLYVMDSDLLKFFLPMRTIVPILLLTSAVLLAVTAVRSGVGARRATPAILAGVAAASALAVYVREFRAYRELELRFENAGAILAGTLYLPDGEGPFPAAVIAQGSMRAPRRLYHLWADRLARSGIAAFSFDKRGTGQSGGRYEAENNSSAENLMLLASDVAAAVTATRGHEAIDPARVGIVGLSMGGWLGPIATRSVDSVAFMVLISGPAVSVGEENYYSSLTGDGHRATAGLSQSARDSLVRDRPPGGFDPRPVLQGSQVPMLWLYGGDDASIPVAKSTAVLDTLIIQHGRPYRYRVFPDAAHLGFVMRWPFDLAPGFGEAMTDWIKAEAENR